MKQMQGEPPLQQGNKNNLLKKNALGKK